MDRLDSGWEASQTMSLKTAWSRGQHTEISSISLPYRETLTRLMKISGKGAKHYIRSDWGDVEWKWWATGSMKNKLRRASRSQTTNGGIYQTWQIYKLSPQSWLSLHITPYHTKLRFCSSNVRAARVGQRWTDSVDLLGSFWSLFCVIHLRLKLGQQLERRRLGFHSQSHGGVLILHLTREID